ncbi:response regulator [Cohnella sp. CFH 77786]|nr:response regulator [Cohnella sp. CFH 77786]
MRILVADDHPIFREGLLSILLSEPDFEVVGEMENGEDTIEAAELLQPDILLMDVHMPGKNGIEATREITKNCPSIGFLMLTMFDDDASVFSAMRAGARGYMLKGAGKTEIIRAIRTVTGGDAIFSAPIARRMIYDFDTLARKPAAMLFPQLTERERSVLAWIAKGKDNAYIAQKLGLSHKTIQNNVTNILNKLQVADRGQAILLAREAGLVHEE